MHKEIYDYIRSCERCQRNNDIFHKPHSTLHPIPVPGEVWQQVQQVQHENDHIILLLFLDR